MLFGLCNAPATFQRIMNNLLKNIKNILIYLDDILIYCEDYKNHYHTLLQIFKTFNQNNVSINFEKSKFLQKDFNFLGHLIKAEGIQPDLSKISKYVFKIPKKRPSFKRY
ncbi:Retrovirus-related Pol polyprotein from transposon [Dictyocoela muelleri]|nr:Retrovirus-related Pol polyprotein from transposon [Dictyocoela muelleri]